MVAMKVKHIIFLVVSVLMLASCMAMDSREMPDPSAPYTVDAVVTVKQDADRTVFFKLTDDQRLFPGNDYPFTRQQRAWGSLTIYAEEIPLYGYKVGVNWLEPLDEGLFVKSAPSVQTAAGIDPVIGSWVTSVQDGYLTLMYTAWWGETAGHHDFYLYSADASDPYNLTLVHDSHADASDSYNEAIICFDINTLPPTGDEYKPLTLNWISTQGKAEAAQFEFRSRK